MPKVISPRLFPACPINTGALSLPKMNLIQAMEFYWRVKIWKISLSASFTSPPPAQPQNILEEFELSVGTGEGRFLGWEFGGVSPLDERFLVCGPGFTWGFDPFEAIGDSMIGFGAATSPNSGIGATCFVDASAVFVALNRDYYIPFDFFANMGNAIASFNPQPVGYDEVAEAGNFIITMNSGTITTPIYCQYFAGYFIDISILMIADEWWDYGGNYDSATGVPR